MNQDEDNSGCKGLQKCPKRQYVDLDEEFDVVSFQLQKKTF